MQWFCKPQSRVRFPGFPPFQYGRPRAKVLGVRRQVGIVDGVDRQRKDRNMAEETCDHHWHQETVKETYPCGASKSREKSKCCVCNEYYDYSKIVWGGALTQYYPGGTTWKQYP